MIRKKKGKLIDWYLPGLLAGTPFVPRLILLKCSPKEEFLCYFYCGEFLEHLQACSSKRKRVEIQMSPPEDCAKA